MELDSLVTNKVNRLTCLIRSLNCIVWSQCSTLSPPLRPDALALGLDLTCIVGGYSHIMPLHVWQSALTVVYGVRSRGLVKVVYCKDTGRIGGSREIHSCRCRHGRGRLVRQFHHVDIIASAAKTLHIRRPAEFSEVEGCNKTLEFPLIVYLNMIEPFGSSLHWLVIWDESMIFLEG